MPGPEHLLWRSGGLTVWRQYHLARRRCYMRPWSLSRRLKHSVGRAGAIEAVQPWQRGTAPSDRGCLGRQFEVGSRGRANGWSSCVVFSAAMASVLRPAMAWGTPGKGRVHARREESSGATRRRLALDRPTFCFCGATCMLPPAEHARRGPRVTHNGRRGAVHDYNTRQRLCAARRVQPPERVVVHAAPLRVSGLAHLVPALSLKPSAIIRRSPSLQVPKHRLVAIHAQTALRTLPKTAPVSFSFHVPQPRLPYWPCPICPSKRRRRPHVAPGNAFMETENS
ncbi:hypothetical protein T440DRAFT_477799 [Plenodomus tracheiphilus IPT5]|uniref:Uncharacterized protein n=1 Tax=Plenodomus tracheiphilus IPT5 TaxID=1408161 RepID=A0A6A7BAE9_9PLEO|nr:hypothetical protein T440DRAFT_477799 [Plenodomus tracheiphilus IPT5]